MTKDFQKALTDGLLTGYAGKTSKPVTRGDVFSGDVSHIELPGGGIYHDEWFVETHLGGGQELVEINGIRYTRLYGGGTPDPSVLAELGLEIKDVGKYLVTKIIELGDKTRLLQNCNPEPDGDWQYKYVITSTNPEIEVITATESID
ncbi:MAG: hypothetical protein Q7S79_03280, partial [bacterium]|nr:hypothetical protein [bacterium]